MGSGIALALLLVGGGGEKGKRRRYALWLQVQEVFACARAIVTHVPAVPKLTPKNAFRLRKPSVLTDCLRRFDL